MSDMNFIDSLNDFGLTRQEGLIYSALLNHGEMTGYEVAKDFDRVYDYIFRRLVEGNIKKDPEIIEDTLRHIRDMRDTWKEVMQKTKNGNDTGQRIASVG